MRQLCFALSLLFPAAILTADEVPLPAKENFHLFLLVGQSNMAGRGEVTPDDQQPDPRVLMLNKDGRWVPAVDPMHFDKPSVGVGLGRTFGLEIAKATPGVTIGLIPCAVGGSPIETWEPGAFDEATKTHPWDDAMTRARLALPAGTLKGILWHQGESDSTPERAGLYEQRMHDLIARFRTELAAPAVPFIAGQMGIFPESPWSAEKKIVDRVHQNLPAQIKRSAFVSAGGLTHKGDKVHFDSASYRELGKRYAAAFLAIKP
jgi:hypothetical protein